MHPKSFLKILYYFFHEIGCFTAVERDTENNRGINMQLFMVER